SPIFTESVDDRDIKKKSTVYDEEGKEIPEGQDKDTGDRPPTLKRKEGDVDRMPQVAPPKKEAPKVQSADDDPERPRLKRGAPSQSGGAGNAGAAAGAGSAPAPASASPSGTAGTKPEDDPNRPRLKRGGSGQQKTGTSETDQSAGTPVPARVQARGDVQPVVKPGAGFATRTFEAVAVSDAEDADKMAVRQDFRFRTSSSEREELLTKMRRIAQDEAMKSLRANGRWPKAAAGPAGARRPQVVAVPALTDAQMAGLDLDSNNSAELVYSGRASLDSGITVFVTVVARTDVDGNPRKLFSSVATSDRLDVTPRLELVDAVDADSDRRGELLFRRIRDNSAEYVLYRVGTDGLTELFHGGAAD
ncbi:MAG TPA: hypothetical protein VMZ25_06120, partial [Terriglobales bacterium]|nr:hypothetical protein [Terriglobales bacterium]